MKLLLLFLLTTQTGSFVCGAQCVQQHTHGMNHCAMHHSEEAAKQTCSAAHTLCATDLQATHPNSTGVPSPNFQPQSQQPLTEPNLIFYSILPAQLRSTPGVSQSVAPLRV